jgi:hypothetical protein
LSLRKQTPLNRQNGNTAATNKTKMRIVELTTPQRHEYHDFRHLLFRLWHYWHDLLLPPTNETTTNKTTEMACMCKNTKLIKKMQDEIPKVCKAPADQAVFALFFNAQCVGQAGFPIAMGAVNKDGTINNSTGTLEDIWDSSLLELGA